MNPTEQLINEADFEYAKQKTALNKDQVKNNNFDPTAVQRNIKENKKEDKKAKKAAILDKLIERQQSTSPSLKILLETLKTHEPPHSYGEEITNEMEEKEVQRCQRFGFDYNPERNKSRRRIFFGSLIADDSWHPIAVHAAEAYGLYHTVAFIESNITTADTRKRVKSRELRFVPTTDSSTSASKNDNDPLFNLQVLQSGIFGPKTKVTVDLHIDNVDERTD